MSVKTAKTGLEVERAIELMDKSLTLCVRTRDDVILEALHHGAIGALLWVMGIQQDFYKDGFNKVLEASRDIDRQGAYDLFGIKSELLD